MSSCGGNVDATGASGAGGMSGTAGTSGAAGVGGTGGTTSVPGDFEVVVVDDDDQPLAGALVVLDRPSGAREETITDALGVATFAPVDFSVGSIDLTAFSPERILTTLLEVTGPIAPIRLHRIGQRVFDDKIVSSKLLNRTGSATQVTATVPFEVRGWGDPYELGLAPGGGKIVALDYNSTQPYGLHAAVVADIPPTTTTLDLDFSKSLPIEHATGTIPFPFDDTYSLWLLEVDVTSIDWKTHLLASITTKSNSENGALHWAADFVRPVPESEVVTRYEATFYTEQGGGWSSVYVPGYPEHGAPPFPSFAYFVGGNPNCSYESTLELFNTLSWEANSERPDTLSVLSADEPLNPTGGQTFNVVWRIHFPPERDALTLVRPADSIWNALPWSSYPQLESYLSYCEPSGFGVRCHRAATSFPCIVANTP